VQLDPATKTGSYKILDVIVERNMPWICFWILVACKGM
jgi:hypothetical protein